MQRSLDARSRPRTATSHGSGRERIHPAEGSSAHPVWYIVSSKEGKFLALNQLTETGKCSVERKRNEISKALFEFCQREYGDRKGTAHFADLVNAVDCFVRLTKRLKDYDLYIKVTIFIRTFQATQCAKAGKKFESKFRLIEDLLQ